MTENIKMLNNLIVFKSSEIFHIEAALNNLKVVCSLQSKDNPSGNSENTNKIINDLYLRTEDLKIEIASYEREIKRIKQDQNDQLVMANAYL